MMKELWILRNAVMGKPTVAQDELAMLRIVQWVCSVGEEESIKWP